MINIKSENSIHLIMEKKHWIHNQKCSAW